MANEVYANGREVSCKAADGKSVAAFPDVCLTPPSPPAGPLPIPYPNTGMASDTTDGSKNVKISGKEVNLKDSSCFKKSTGDEAATKAQGMSVITHQIQGKVYYKSWSMDVKIEGENAVRHLDMMTHNHASEVGATPPWPYMDEMSAAVQKACEEDIKKAEEACKDSSMPDNCEDKCKTAQKCLLVPKSKDKDRCCKPASTGHHLIEDHWVTNSPGFQMPGGASYSNGAAPTVCVEGGRTEKEHGLMHALQGIAEDSFLPAKGKRKAGLNHERGKKWNYGNGKTSAIRAHQLTFQGSDCKKKCLEAQIDAYHGSDPSRPLGQSKSRQSIVDREEAEVITDMMFNGHVMA